MRKQSTVLEHQKLLHLKLRCVKCAGDHLTNHCHRKERSSDVRGVLCAGNHPANYKGCMVYKDRTLHTQPKATYVQITKENSYAARKI
jgi:hypothetical protein